MISKIPDIDIIRILRPAPYGLLILESRCCIQTDNGRENTVNYWYWKFQWIAVPGRTEGTSGTFLK